MWDWGQGIVLVSEGPKGWAKNNVPFFFGRLFRQTSNVDILETVCSNDLKFEVRIVLDRVPLQIKF